MITVKEEATVFQETALLKNNNKRQFYNNSNNSKFRKLQRE